MDAGRPVVVAPLSPEKKREAKQMPAAKHARREFVQPREPASGTFNDEPFVINPAEVFAADHPLVRKYPHLFRPLEASRGRPSVEQVTAAPGEQR